MSRYARAVDANQAAIVAALREAGATRTRRRLVVYLRQAIYERDGA